MVAAAKDSKKKSPEETLRARVKNLTDELDALDHRQAQAAEALKGAVITLAGMGPAEMGGQVGQAVAGLKKAVAKRKPDLDKIGAAIDELKSALLAEPAQNGKARVSDWKAQEEQERSQAMGRAAAHAVLALLQGLRVGDPEYDKFLDDSIQRILKLLKAGDVRPVMSAVVDVIDRFRSVLDERRLAAESALRDILRELLDAEGDMTAHFESRNVEMAKSGESYNRSLTASVGRLVVEIQQARDLEGLKLRALDHIRALRDQIRARQAEEKSQLESSRRELDRLRETLASTRQRMAKVEKMRQKLRDDALTDPMTGLWNKRALTERLGEALASSEMHPLGLIVFDIDNFKKINDTFGHQAGDRALKAMADQTSKALRASDVLFRYAGDEFVVMLPATGPEEALAVAERIREGSLALEFTYRGSGELRVSLSLGITVSRSGDDPESIFERADMALLKAKRQGRNQSLMAD
jgi:diguanylate cyclase